MNFKLTSQFTPQGDQPKAIEEIILRLKKNEKEVILLGVTGSGKTFTMANIIQEFNRPVLIMAPNKTLAAQLYGEFKELFPENAVEYFVSYYDYYQPEAYLPATDTYIEKDASINELIDKMRHSATRSLLTRKDVIVIASVSCIYGLGDPKEYEKMHLFLNIGQAIKREDVIKKLISMQYERSDIDFYRGTFRARGDVLDIFPSHETDKAFRVEFFGDEIESVTEMDPLTGKAITKPKEIHIYPNTHHITNMEKLKISLDNIRIELQERLKHLKELNKPLEAHRLEKRTLFDLEMIEEIGYCQGIENYSRHFDGRKPGEPPPTLLSYMSKDFLLFVDESHITVPQIGGMYRGDRVRKETLVEHGFRLPSALDNRPLTFEEFEKNKNQIVYVSATPGDYETLKMKAPIVRQVIRPTGLIDPKITVKPAKGQVEDVYNLCEERVMKSERVLITTLTKRMAEDLTEFLSGKGLKVRYLHSDIETLERVEILKALRLKEFDILVGINLLREGLDLPEVSLVAILDSDKEGFLRSERSLIQTFGRAARNINGEVIMYADKMTKAMNAAIKETNLRRSIQMDYNKKHNITPQTIIKNISNALTSADMDYFEIEIEKPSPKIKKFDSQKDRDKHIDQLRTRMLKAAANLEFELAASLRDEINGLLKEGLV